MNIEPQLPSVRPADSLVSPSASVTEQEPQLQPSLSVSSTPQPREAEPANPAQIEPAESPTLDFAKPPEIDSVESLVFDFVKFPATNTVGPPMSPVKSSSSPGFQSSLMAPLPLFLRAYLQSSTSTQSMPPSLSSPNPDQDMPFATAENRKELAFVDLRQVVSVACYPPFYDVNLRHLPHIYIVSISS